MVKIATADLETDPFKNGRIPKAFDAGFFDGNNHFEFWGKNCCQQLVEQCLWDWKGKVYFHNGGKFDFHFLMPYLPDEIEVFILKSRIIRIKFRQCVLLDSYAILPIALKATGEKDDIEYWKLEESQDDLLDDEIAILHDDILERYGEEKINHNLLYQSPRVFYRDEIISYRRQDNKALFDLVKGFVDEYGDGLTLANRAFNELKKLDLKPSWGSKSMDGMLRPFYYGGRVQCFKTGIFKGDFKVIDINSAYPYAMTFPHFWGSDFLTSTRLPNKPELIQNCFIQLTCHSEGALPSRAKNGSLTFPIGEQEFNVSGWEYLAGLETKTIKNIKIHKVYVPFEVKKFTPFVDKFFAKKHKAEKDGDSQGRLFAKLMLTSAYGKFALNPEHFREHKILPIGENPNPPELLDEINELELQLHKDHDEEISIQLNILYRSIWNLAQNFDTWGLAIWEKKTAEEDFRYYHVGTAASITGFVRAYLWKAIKKADNPLYCDTDSIICSGVDNIPLSSKLGDWDLEAEGKSVAIAGKKLYSFKCNDDKFKIASKGVRISPLDIFNIAKGETIEWENIAPSYSIKKEPHFIKRKIRKTS